jgi:5-formyltetrahydrofolate cyclo-ligase
MSTPDEATLALVMRAKTVLRKRLRGLRQTTPTSACAKRSDLIVERLLTMEVVTAASTVALFAPILERHEVDLRRLDSSLRERGTSLAYPYVDAETREMTFRTCAPGGLVEDPLGFLAPPPSAPEPGRLEVIVVPALALDARGHRLGYGAGFYDRTLPRYPASTTIGVAYDFQLLAEVPALEDDVPVRWIVTDTRTLESVAT